MGIYSDPNYSYRSGKLERFILFCVLMIALAGMTGVYIYCNNPENEKKIRDSLPVSTLILYSDQGNVLEKWEHVIQVNQWDAGTTFIDKDSGKRITFPSNSKYVIKEN